MPSTTAFAMITARITAVKTGDSTSLQSRSFRTSAFTARNCTLAPRMPAERVPLETHLEGLSPSERALWDRFAELVEAAGPSEMVVTKSRIAFRAHRIFAGGFFRTRRLELFFDLPEPVPEADRDDRFRAVWEQANRLWTHRLMITSPDELDDDVAAWLKESWSVYSRPPEER
jgi:uncharacterized protein DUF5655